VLGIQELYINEKSNSFGDFALGAGFDINRFEPLTQHVFKEFVDADVTNGVTYDFLPLKKSTTRCGVVRTERDLSEKLGLEGEGSVTKATMSGSGFFKYDQSTEKMEKVMYYTCVIDRGLFTISLNPPQVNLDAPNEVLSEVLPKHLVNLDNEETFIEMAGDYHVRSITYGRRYKAEVMVSYQHDETYESFAAEIEMEYGKVGLSLAAQVSVDWAESGSHTDMRMSASSEAYGFIPPETLQLPSGTTTVTEEDGTTKDLSPFEFVERQIKINLEKMDEMDASTAGVDGAPSPLVAATGLNRGQLFERMGDAYPLSYSIAKNQPYYSILTPLTGMQERDMIQNIDEAYDILRELNSLYEDVTNRAEKLFENYHLLSDESDLSIPFLHVRQAIMDEIASYQRQVKVYLTRLPIYLSDYNIYEWAQTTDFDALNSEGSPIYSWAQVEEFTALEHISLDVLRSKVWRLLGMEDGSMNIAEDAIGATCIFNGIEGDYSFDNGETMQRLHFAGRVVFADKVIRHVVFNQEQDVVSLGFIDHDADENEGWPDLDNPLCGDHTTQQLHHELVFVKNDCTLLRFGTPVWYEDARYVVCGIGSAEHLTSSGYVNKDMLSSIRINLVPVDSAQDITIVLTENEIQHVKPRGAENSLGFGMDDHNRLMWSNGYVCDWSFGVKEAKMVCSELGYSRIEKFETNVELPTSNAWERPLIKMYDIECQEYAMTLEGGHCTYSTQPAGINWDRCSKNNGIALECTDLILDQDDIQAEIHSSNSEGCHFNEDVVDFGVVNTDEYCLGGEDHEDEFGIVTEVDIQGSVCLNFIVNDEVQCVFSEGTNFLEGCGSTEMTQDKEGMLASGWEIADGFTAISNEQCSSSTFNGQPSNVDSDTISKTFSGSGHATITFGNCGNSGDVILSFNGHQIASAHAGSFAEIVTVAFSDAQELTLSVEPDAEGNADAVIRVQQLRITYPCESVEGILSLSGASIIDPQPEDINYVFIGDGACRASDCNVDDNNCKVNGFWRDDSSLAECMAMCESSAGCNGISFSDSSSLNPLRCYVLGELYMAVPDEWNHFEKSRYDVAQVKTFTGWKCWARQETNEDVVADISYPNCYTSYDPSIFPESIEVISDALEYGGQTVQYGYGLSAVSVTIPEFHTYTISGKLVEYINLDGDSVNVPNDFWIDVKVTIDGILNTMEFNLEEEWETTEDTNISGLRCATSFQIEVVSDQLQQTNVCKPIGNRPIDSEGKGIISGSDIEIQISCQQLAVGTVASYYFPPEGCECVGTERTDGFYWPASCALLPGSDDTPFCYVDPSSCSSAVSDIFSNEYGSVECTLDQFVYWIAPSEIGDSYLPSISLFLSQEFPEWVKSDVYDFETVDLVIFLRGTDSDFGDLLDDADWDRSDFLADVESRNVGVVDMGHNGWSGDWKTYTWAPLPLITQSTYGYWTSEPAPQPVVIDQDDEILTDGFSTGQSIEFAEPATCFSTDGQAYQCPDIGYAVNVFNPSGDFEIVAHTYHDGEEKPTLAYHKTRPIIAVPWQKDGTYGKLTQDGRQLMKNSFSWVENARAQSSGRRMLAEELNFPSESAESHVQMMVLLSVVVFAAICFCALRRGKRNATGTDFNQSGVEVISAF